MKNSQAVIFSLAGPALNEKERDFFRASSPLGFILFARNCVNPQQVRKLTDDLRDCVGWHCPILIDQEGGRVQRLKPPYWRQHEPMRVFGERAENGDFEGAVESLGFSTLQIAEELVAAGVDVNCAPVLDVLAPQTDEVIGDRAFSADPQLVAQLGLSVCRHYLAAGITPVIKHIPGHGRAAADSHKELPVVDAPLSAMMHTDFEPFRVVAGSEVGRAVWGMTAHVVYTAVDPDHPITVSKPGIEGIIRRSIGFDGFLLSDDLDMEALAGYGRVPERCGAVLESGCDAALYCAGKLEIMEKIAESVPKLSQKALERLQKAVEFRKVAA
ncbi:MAG TPA: beta-N-acetylhexosaminidase [Rhodospirillaceae bacterium]|nr:beta-N-acetylhexosaminidase [Rhodospirillaceae bacterium]